MPAPLIAQSGGVDADAVPLTETLQRVDKAVRHTSRVRVVTHRGVLVLKDVHVDEQGVHYASILEGDGADTLRAPGVIPWSRVAQVDKRVSAAARGAKWGAIVIGLPAAVLAGVFVLAWEGTASQTAGSAMLGAMGGALAGAGVGALLTSPGRAWQRVYPRDADMTRR